MVQECLLRKLRFILFALLILSTCPIQAKEVLRVLCFGDSVTLGTFVNGKYVINRSWVNILQELVGDKIQMINLGRVGRKTSNKAELIKVIKQNEGIDHLILFLGINDLSIANEDVLNSCVTNTDWMVKKSCNAYKDVKITIVSSPGLSIGNVIERWHNAGYNEKEQAMLNKLRQKYKQYAETNNCNFIDLWGLVSKENYSDGLHPNLEGQQKIAEAVWNSLIKYDTRLR